MNYSVYDPKDTPKPFGFNNTGVICWCNSLLQLLLSCSSLNRLLLEHEAEFAQNEFAKEYIALLKEVLPYNRETMSSVVMNCSQRILAALVYEMRKANQTIKFGSSQECVDEALTLFIERFNNKKVETLFMNSYELKIKCDTCKKVVSSKRDNGYRIAVLCRKQLETMEDFCNYLRIHPSEHDEFVCEVCNTKMRDFNRMENLKMLREIVVIIFNKYQEKTNRWFPQELVFGSTNGKKLRYKLVAQVEHSGTQFGGHYTAKALRNGSVYSFNDTAVYPGNLGPTPLTYMIAYHLVGEFEATVTPPEPHPVA